jgi:hypothetical protein
MKKIINIFLACMLIPVAFVFAGSCYLTFYYSWHLIYRKIKIPSVTVTAIKNEMRQFLKKEGKRNFATQGGTGNESKSHEHGRAKHRRYPPVRPP